MENFEITSGPLPGSEKIYVTGSRSDIRVPMRKIKLSPTVDLDGSKIENEDVVVYDTSGPIQIRIILSICKKVFLN